VRGLALVTGATGLVGNSVVRHLLADGHSVRVLVRPTSDPRALVGLTVQRVVGDVRDRHAAARAVAGVERVYHAAALVRVGTRGLQEFREVNVEGVRVVAQATREVGARLVHVSSVDTLGFGTRAEPAHEETPPDASIRFPYVVSKREAEVAVKREIDRGLDAVIVNPAYLLGPWDWKPSSGRLLLRIARGLGRIAPPGGNDFCHSLDVAAGIVAAADRGVRGERYILGGEALSYRDAFALFAEITGGVTPWLTPSAALIRTAGSLGSMWGWLSGREPELNRGSAALACLPHHFDDTKARRELGYRSRSAREAAEDGWVWLLEHGYARGARQS